MVHGWADYYSVCLKKRKQTIKKRNKNKNMNVENIVKENAGTIVDVRTPAEFMGGHVADSVNIPLQEIPYRMDELKNMKQPLVLCCASGNRSGQATYYLTQEGISCVNGGSWLSVNYLKSLAV